MALNSAKAIILHYLAEIGSFGSAIKVVEVMPILSAKNLVFGNVLFSAVFSVITEKECVKDRTGTHSPPHSTAKIQFVQHCAAPAISVGL